MNYKVLALLSLLLFFSCDKKGENTTSTPKAVIKKDPIIKEFGFTLNDFKVERDTVKSGETFGTIMQKHQLGDLRVHEITEKARDSFKFRDIRAGKPYTILKSKTAPNPVQVFIYERDNIHYSIIDLRDSIVAYNKTKPISIKKRTIATKIEGSLSETLNAAGVDASLAQKLASIYAYSIDFFKIQKGDQFAVTFNEKYINDSIYVGVESLEASFFVHKGKKIYAFPFKQDTSSTKVNYYDQEGKVLKTMFLKAPLKFGFRISSKFSANRFHPVQHRWKAHKGTDYAAPHGTPIVSTANGVVEQTGYTAGNGNYVKIKHNSTYSTQYLHMSKILVRRGQRVSQGDVIGKVGSTGLATGPHVCYRFWKNGVQVDALKQKLPNSIPMETKYKARFMAEMEPMKKELDSVAALKFKSN
ncbi:peptidoglycan DD-metalloendopeptidase family protein [Flavobacterium sp. NST-5]|uniref:Peptidoglycan DD-metalloendopeptidase family protein n=1 Tax=Flavobacterium ichthyis TaxID=2698827 RepID=A0ABW9ZDU2_9FLAO|nr:peptidoglycan DD-metalloendopeptidase family protein [Flavobacterium ichthyis]NBL65472.1 peptidoglycan DD-metalloendopeptidase family protein [Flavobacterium ichthyis]